MRNAKDISFMFAEATSFNGDLTTWQLVNVEKMTSVFDGAVRAGQRFLQILLLRILTVFFWFYTCRTGIVQWRSN